MADLRQPPDHRDKAAVAASYRQIISSTSMIGGASVVNILIGIVRTKLLALILGPAGIGLIGLLNTLMTTAATVAQMGLGTVGVRQVAEANATGSAERLVLARRALLVVTLLLALGGGGLVWLLREPLAVFVLRNPAMADAVGWIAVGVALSIAALAQTAFINGMRRIRDLALLNIGGALAATVIGVPLIWYFGQAAIAWYVVVVPATAFLLGWFFLLRIPRPGAAAPPSRAIGAEMGRLLVLGVPLMGAAVANTATTLWIQSDIQRQLGVEALGFYVAASTIGIHYVALVLGAMGADYYPRLTAAIGDPASARVLVDHQTEVALLLAGPICLSLVGLAPFILAVFYSVAFTSAADVLRLLALAALMKAMTWPMGFILLAQGAGRLFLMTEVLVLAIMAGASTLLVGRMGVTGAGIAVIAAYLVYLPILKVVVAPRIGYRWSGPVVIQATGLVLATIVTGLTALFSDITAAILGAGLAIAFGIFAALRLAHILGAPSRLSRLVQALRARVLPIIPRDQ